MCVCVCVCVCVLVTLSCLTFCDPMDHIELARLLCPWNSSGKNTGVGCHALLQGNLLDAGIKPTPLMSPALVVMFFTTSTSWEAYICMYGPSMMGSGFLTKYNC